MKRKKLMAAVAAAILTFSAAGISSTTEAAIGGMRAPRMSVPRMSTPRPQAPRSTSPSNSARPNQQYRASQKASDIPSTAPRGGANTQSRAGANSVPYNGTRWGNTMRNMGLLAGGMMLGSMLGSMFGFGAGSFMSDLFGLLFNGLIIYMVVQLLARLWAHFRGGSASRTNPYQREARAAETAAPFPIRDIRPPQAAHSVVHQDNPGTDYEPKRTADWYRSR